MDFESISLATRTKCHAARHELCLHHHRSRCDHDDPDDNHEEVPERMSAPMSSRMISVHARRYFLRAPSGSGGASPAAPDGGTTCQEGLGAATGQLQGFPIPGPHSMIDRTSTGIATRGMFYYSSGLGLYRCSYGIWSLMKHLFW